MCSWQISLIIIIALILNNLKSVLGFDELELLDMAWCPDYDNRPPASRSAKMEIFSSECKCNANIFLTPGSQRHVTCVITRLYNNLQNNWVMQTGLKLLGSKCSRIIFSFLGIISTCNWFETIICLDHLSSLAVDHWTFNQTLFWNLRNWECSVTGGREWDADFTEHKH